MLPSVPEPTESSATAAVQSRRVTVVLYAVVAFLYWASLYLYAPTLPTFVETRAETLALVGIVLAQYGLWQAIIRLPLGIAGDWLGWHKPLLLVGFGLCGLGALVMAMSNGVGGLALGRAITGLAAGTWVPLIVAFSALFPPEEAVRATALLTFVGSFSRALVSGVTGSLNALGGYSLPFLLAAGAAGLAVLITLPTPNRRHPPQRPSFSSTGHLIVRRDVLLPALLAAVSQYANWAATFSFMPILAQRLGGTGVTLSLLLSLHIAVVMLGNLGTTAIAHRIGARYLVAISFALLAVGLGIAAMAPTLAVIFGAQVVLGLSQGVGYPLLMGLSIRYVVQDNRTTAMGLHQAVYAVGMFGGPWLSGILADAIGIQPMFGVTALGCLALGIGGASMLRRKSEE
jgi:predicted MFS family arabinose efflux permease